ncbi:hypothetical protein AVEN_33899-1 [Araneus ventricosus]|uniref:Uncharacterized protein n=1 Tax=Araneus ventricosus TaxID=182803 RepID=A0A4Y2EKP3_ARAVE|nr:hypothetical protein AVEN_33899-1 [Araneus ventricosus]
MRSKKVLYLWLHSETNGRKRVEGQELITISSGLERERCFVSLVTSARFAVLEPSNLIESLETEFPENVKSVVENYSEFPADGILTEIPHLRRSLNAATVPKEQSLGSTSLRVVA